MTQKGRKQFRVKWYIVPVVVLLTIPAAAFSQMITGTWKGKINRQKAEVKIILTGDSLTGTSYYYESANNYRRYSIRGYFDPVTNSAVWWDDRLLEERSGRLSISIPGKVPLLSRADFNCPGGGKMMLDGKTGKKETEEEPGGDLHLDKTNNPVFEDEWDFVIDNYTSGANDPDIIDSIGRIAGQPPLREIPDQPAPRKEETVIVSPPPAKPAEPIVDNTPKTTEKPALPVASISPPVSIKEKFETRKKVFVREIPLQGDSLELRFYDNAEIDGDSISLFLNGKLLLEHIRLTGNAYIIHLPLAELPETSELIMVAENLGAIPPNTSYMLAINGEKRYDAYLSSTEGSSAMIRLVRKKETQ